MYISPELYERLSVYAQGRLGKRGLQVNYIYIYIYLRTIGPATGIVRFDYLGLSKTKRVLRLVEPLLTWIYSSHLEQRLFFLSVLFQPKP